MKIKLLLLLILVAVSALAAGPSTSTRTNCVLTSDYPTNELSTNLWFKVYSSTNVSIPVTSWPLIAIVPGTNATFTLPLDFNQRFYVVKSSNSWWRAESDFSNVAGTQPVPRDVINLRLDLSAP